MCKSVLAIDDEMGVLRAIMESLEPEFHVRTAECGDKALDMLSKEQPDIVILDYRLPDMLGDVLAVRIKARYPGIPIVVLSGVTDTDCVVRLMRAGTMDYLTKPFDATELRAVVRESLKVSLPADASPACESLLGISPPMSRLQRRFAEAAREGHHILLLADGGFDPVGVSRAISRLAGPGTPFAIAQPGDRPLIPDTFPPSGRGVIHFPLTLETLPAAQTALDEARRRQGSAGCTIQLSFDAMSFARAAGELPEVAEAFEAWSKGDRMERVGSAAPSPVGPHRLMAPLDELLRGHPDVTCLFLPPLRERPEDIPHCLRYFIDKHARRAGRTIRSIALDALDLLLSYPWPGNILEMDCVIEEIVRGETGPEIGAAAATRLDAGAYAASAFNASRFANDTLPEGLRRLDRLMGVQRHAISNPMAG